jgi:hypothetical protein
LRIDEAIRAPAHADRRTHHEPPGAIWKAFTRLSPARVSPGESERSQVTEGSSERQRFPLMFRMGQYCCFDHLWLPDSL